MRSNVDFWLGVASAVAIALFCGLIIISFWLPSHVVSHSQASVITGDCGKWDGGCPRPIADPTAKPKPPSRAPIEEYNGGGPL